MDYFFVGGVLRRACVNGSWSSIDFSECTLPVGTKVSLLLWLPLLGTKKAVLNKTRAILRDVCLMCLKVNACWRAWPWIKLGYGWQWSNSILNKYRRDLTEYSNLYVPNKREDSVFSLNIKVWVVSHINLRVFMINLTTSKIVLEGIVEWALMLKVCWGGHWKSSLLPTINNHLLNNCLLVNNRWKKHFKWTPWGHRLQSTLTSWTPLVQ